jgi:hypothetical protein
MVYNAAQSYIDPYVATYAATKAFRRSGNTPPH